MQKYAFVRRVHLLYLSRESVTIFAVLKRDKGLTPRPGQVSHSGSWILSERHPTGAEQQKGILGCIGGTPASEGSRHGSGEAGTGKQIPGISPPRMKFPLQGSIQPNERARFQSKSIWDARGDKLIEAKIEEVKSPATSGGGPGGVPGDQR
jgi:hypothetical protein